MKEETSMNVWKESFLNEICFLTRTDDLRKVAGNWATYCTDCRMWTGLNAEGRYQIQVGEGGGEGWALLP